MSGKFNIVDGKGTGNRSAVDDLGAVRVNDTRLPPFDYENKIRPFRQYLTNDGTNSGSFDMRVTGTAAAPIDFWVETATDADRYISSISFVIADANAALNLFGFTTALTNGCQLFYFDDDLGNVDIHDSLKSNFDFIRLCGGRPGFGDAATAFRASNVSGSSEGYIPFLDIVDVFEMPWGIRLKKSTTNKIVMKIKDDTSGVDAFNAIAYGFDRIID